MCENHYASGSVTIMKLLLLSPQSLWGVVLYFINGFNFLKNKVRNKERNTNVAFKKADMKGWTVDGR